MVEINWTIVTYTVVGLFALGGFSRGWWREAVTTIALVVLVALLQNPDIAQAVINFVNDILGFIWEVIPEAFRSTLSSILQSIFGVETSSRGIQADAASPDNWLLILLVSIVIAVLASRLFLPGGYRRQGYTYDVTPIGAMLGALLGGLNGLIILNLVQEYVLARNLPGGGPVTEIAFANGGGVARASSGLAIAATGVPGLSLFDGPIPWVLIGFGVILLLVILRHRVGLHSRNGFRRIDYKLPYGYKLVKYKPE